MSRNRPRTVRWFSPTFRIVASMPGIDTGGLDRTDTSNGRRVPPIERPVVFSSQRTCAVSDVVRSSGNRRPRSK